MSDPCSAARTNDRLKRRYQAARRRLQGDLSVISIVDIRLPVGDDEHLGAGQDFMQEILQCGRRPFNLSGSDRLPTAFDLFQQFLDLDIDRGPVARRGKDVAPERTSSMARRNEFIQPRSITTMNRLRHPRWI